MNRILVIEELLEEINSVNYIEIINNVKSYLKKEYKVIDKDIFTLFLKIDVLDKIDNKLQVVSKTRQRDRNKNIQYINSLNDFRTELINLYYPLLKIYEEYSCSNNVETYFNDLINIITDGFHSYHLFDIKFNVFKEKVNKHYSLVEDFRFISNACLNFYETLLKIKIKYESRIVLIKEQIDNYIKNYDHNLEFVLSSDNINGDYKLKDFIFDQDQTILELEKAIYYLDKILDYFLNKDKFIGNQIVFKNPVFARTEDELKSRFKNLLEYDSSKLNEYLSHHQYEKLTKIESELIAYGYLLKYKKKYLWISTKAKICELCYFLTEDKSFNIDTKYSTFVKFFFQRYNQEITNQDLNKSKNKYYGKSIFQELLK